MLTAREVGWYNLARSITTGKGLRRPPHWWRRLRQAWEVRRGKHPGGVCILCDDPPQHQIDDQPLCAWHYQVCTRPRQALIEIRRMRRIIRTVGRFATSRRGRLSRAGLARIMRDVGEVMNDDSRAQIG